MREARIDTIATGDLPDKPGLHASEEVNALFGFGSDFHSSFGFYIDGVDETTAKLPPGWRKRADEATIADEGKTIRAVAPNVDDLIVSKLHRLDPKDKDFIRACHQARPLDLVLIERRFTDSAPDPAIAASVRGFLASL